MREETMFREIGLVDDDLILEAASASRKRNFRRAVPFMASGTAAAVILLAITSMPFLQQKSNSPPENNYLGEPISSGENAVTEPVEPKEPADSTENVKNSIPDSQEVKVEFKWNPAQEISRDKANYAGYFWEDLKEEEIDHIFPGLQESYTMKMQAHYQQEGKVLYIDGSCITKTGEELYLQASPDKISIDYLFSGQPSVSEIGGVDVTAGYSQINEITTYFAELSIGSTNYYAETSGNKGAEEMAVLVEALIQGEEADFTILSPVIPVYRQDELTLEGANIEQDFGSYFTGRVPAGFVQEEITRFQNQEQDYLRGVWTKGYDYLVWHTRYMSEEARPRLTSTKDKANYDFSLYTFPLMDSVPEELHEIVSNPIFRLEEITLDTVKARTYTIEDAGDSKGARAVFGILYPENILVEIRCKGLTAEQIYDLVTETANKKDKRTSEDPPKKTDQGTNRNTGKETDQGTNRNTGKETDQGTSGNTGKETNIGTEKDTRKNTCIELINETPRQSSPEPITPPDSGETGSIIICQ